jgi:tungstate transport system ATP-binding protein
MNDAIYRLEGIGYEYPGRASSFALEIDSLDIGPGEVLAVVGPNGSGKTTLLMLLALLYRPRRGRLEFQASDPWASHDCAEAARRHVVLVTHHPYLFKGTIADNISCGLRLRKVPLAERPARLRAALAMFELEGRENQSVGRLSAGQVQRAAMARALALQPRVLLLDEPTANIEAGIGLRIEAILREASRESGATVIFSTHDLSQASRLADRTICLSEGRLVRFSHENCFSGMAESDGRTSWIEPRPGVRIFFSGRAHGRVTCVINPSDIHLHVAGDPSAPHRGPNVFSGRITGMEVTDTSTARVRATGDLTLSIVLPVRRLETQGISLSREVVMVFEPESVCILGRVNAAKP